MVDVVSDFHYTSSHQKIGLNAFRNARNAGYSYLLVKINSQTLLSTMTKLEETFKNIVPSLIVNILFYINIFQHSINRKINS